MKHALHRLLAGRVAVCRLAHAMARLSMLGAPSSFLIAADCGADSFFTSEAAVEELRVELDGTTVQRRVRYIVDVVEQGGTPPHLVELDVCLELLDGPVPQTLFVSTDFGDERQRMLVLDNVDGPDGRSQSECLFDGATVQDTGLPFERTLTISTAADQPEPVVVLVQANAVLSWKKQAHVGVATLAQEIID